jgi:nickel transport protein
MIRSVLVAFAVLVAASAHAHSFEIFVREEGGVFKGRAYFSDDDPAKNVTVTVSDAEGVEFGRTTTDAEGAFAYSGELPSDTVVFVASTTDGHRAEARIDRPPSETTPRIVPAGVTSMKSYEAELTELHEAIHGLERRLWLRDVIGGIGYIFGLAGLWALWKSRRPPARE